jgi:hypothetical protein
MRYERMSECSAVVREGVHKGEVTGSNSDDCVVTRLCAKNDGDGVGLWMGYPLQGGFDPADRVATRLCSKKLWGRGGHVDGVAPTRRV